jgi:membrane associated rhomboid family serine protease
MMQAMSEDEEKLPYDVDSIYPDNTWFKDDFGTDPRKFYYPLRIRSNGEPSMARDENIFESLKLFCCPKLGIFQFISIISILEIIAFIISLCIYGVSNEEFLAPDSRALAVMGAADAKSTKNDWELYRLIMPAFLHAHFNHIAGNVMF